MDFNWQKITGTPGLIELGQGYIPRRVKIIKHTKCLDKNRKFSREKTKVREDEN